MFLHVSVIVFTRGVCPIACWDTPRDKAPPPPEQTPSPRTRHPPKQAPPEQAPPQDQAPPPKQAPPEQAPPGAVHAGRYGQRAGGIHPTGMQSCS